MTNFNTNQTRHFYVAGAIDSNVDTNLDIALGQTATGEFYFTYKNADGLITRSDTIDPKRIVCLKKTTKAQMEKPLMAHKIAVDTTAVTLSGLVGKTLNCNITIHQIADYDDSSSVTFTASVVGNSTNTASAAAFHKDLAIAIAKALPKYDKSYPLIKVYSNGSEVTASTAAADVTGASGGVVLVQGLQKYVRGKLNGEPCPFSVAFSYSASNVEDIVWGTDTVSTVAAVNTADTSSIAPTVVPAVYGIADLEYFALGERGDYYRGFNFPNNYETTYAINLASDYDILSIEYYWAGEAENVQKSPRLIQIAGATATINSLYSSVEALTVDGRLSAAEAAIEALGSGSGA